MPKNIKLLLLFSLLLITLSIVFQKFFETKKAQNLKISGIVVPHHNLVKNQRKNLFVQLKNSITAPNTVVLISPNHYDVGSASIQTTSQSWEITEGQIHPNSQVINDLLSVGVEQESTSFINEHGIKLILSDIKTTFPNSKIVPIIFKIKTPSEDVSKVAKTLEKNCFNCLIIASVDFSHYQPAILANLHDHLTQRALETLDNELLLSNTEVDCPACLAFLSSWAKSHYTKMFVLKNHTNSGEILKNADIETTTHFFGWYQTGSQMKSAANVSFTLGGETKIPDNTGFKSGIASVFSKFGDRVFWGTDLSLLLNSDPIPKPLTALRSINLGWVETKSDFVNVKNPLIKNSISPLKVYGQDLVLFCFTIDENYDLEKLKKTVLNLKKNPKNRILILTNWKENNFSSTPTTLQETFAHKLVDIGADLVVGQANVSQSGEIYKTKPIFYSLGRFMSEGGQSTTGLLLSGEFTDENLNLFALPVASENNMPYLLRGQDKKVLLSTLYAPFSSYLKETSFGDLITFPIK